MNKKYKILLPYSIYNKAFLIRKSLSDTKSHLIPCSFLRNYIYLLPILQPNPYPFAVYCNTVEFEELGYLKTNIISPISNALYFKTQKEATDYLDSIFIKCGFKLINDENEAAKYLVLK